MADMVKTHAVIHVGTGWNLIDADSNRVKFDPNDQIDHWGPLLEVYPLPSPFFIHSHSHSLPHWHYLTLLFVRVFNWRLVIIKLLIWIKWDLNLGSSESSLQFEVI